MITTTSGLNLTHGMFGVAPKHIPNADGWPFKTELVLLRSEVRTDKINYWHGPDDDRDPHNHPWKFLTIEEALKHHLVVNAKDDDERTKLILELTGQDITRAVFGSSFPLLSLAGVSFVSTILHGELTQEVFSLSQWKMQRSEATYKAGDTYLFHRDEFHTVINVAPGTVTRMTCGPVVEATEDCSKNEWGYRNKETGVYRKAEPDPSFMERLHANNRFLIKR